jgi:hypothetical protein
MAEPNNLTVIFADMIHFSCVPVSIKGSKMGAGESWQGMRAQRVVSGPPALARPGAQRSSLYACAKSDISAGRKNGV